MTRHGRYELLRVELDGVPQVIRRDDDLDALLTYRDELRENAVLKYRQKRVHYCIADGEDGERGYADWCPECGLHDLHGTFGGSLCRRCEKEAARA